jgi:peptide/nickel transport system substrate-binding protein
MRHPSRLTTLAVAAALLLGVAACNSAADTPPGMKQGGTLRAIVTALPAHLDPQRINAALDADISRLLTRTLTTLKAEPGKASSELTLDLATDLGRPSENNTVWEFRLRDGVKWADGSAITCQHLKYGAERNFASFADGLPYARTYLKDNDAAYKGPFVAGNVGLKSVECIDNKTIQYHLKQPVGDFNYTVGLTIFAPVKPGADSDKDAFDLAPLSSGPYKVKPGSRTETEMTLVRNEFWSSTTDKVRKAYPDQIVIKADTNDPQTTNSLIDDQGDARNTIMLQPDVAANFVQQVMTDSSLLSRTAVGPTGGVRYFAINTKRIPNEKCRQALEFAFNKRKYRQAMGGSLLGDLATSMIPPSLRAYQKFDHYGTLTSGGDGDIKQAQDLIKAAKEKDGVTCPDKITVAHPDRATSVNRFVKTLVDAYLEVGIQVILKPLPPGSYFPTMQRFESEGQYDLIYAGWIPDWANGSAVIPPLFKGSEVATRAGDSGGSNFSYMIDADVDKAIDEAFAESNQERQWNLWGELDSKIQQKAATIPVLYSNAIRLHGSNVSGAFIHAGFGMPDLAALGLLDPGGSAS